MYTTPLLILIGYSLLSKGDYLLGDYPLFNPIEELTLMLLNFVENVLFIQFFFKRSLFNQFFLVTGLEP